MRIQWRRPRDKIRVSETKDVSTKVLSGMRDVVQAKREHLCKLRSKE